MPEHDFTNAKRHRDGSIDYDHYRKGADALRGQAKGTFFKALTNRLIGVSKRGVGDSPTILGQLVR